MSESEILNKIQWFKGHTLTDKPEELLAYERIEAYLRLAIADMLDEYYEAWLAGHPDKYSLIQTIEE